MEKYLFYDSWIASGIIYALGLVVVVALVLTRERWTHFMRNVRTELGKCTWPWDPEQTGFRKYKQLIDSTVIIVVTTLLMAGYVTGFDFLIGNLVGLLINF